MKNKMQLYVVINVQSPVFVGDLLRKQFRISKGSTDSSGNWSGIESAGPGDV